MHIDRTPADRTDRMVEDCLTAQQVLTGPDDVLVLTATRAHAAHLNTAIRDTLHASGYLGTDQLDVDTPRGARGYSTGDQVLVTRNDPSRGLLNGDRATVTTLHPDHGALTLHTRDRRHLTLSGTYLADGRLDHAYALTVHKAQGQTSQITLVAAAPTMTRETAYTALSRGRPYSSRSVQIAHGVLRRALNDAVRDELIPRNVALLVKPGRGDSPAPQPLRPEEIRALLTQAQHDRLYPLLLLLVTLGLRRGEALALRSPRPRRTVRRSGPNTPHSLGRWTDVDLDQGTLTVARSLQRIRTGQLTPSGRRRGRLAEVPPKTAGSIRRIALPGVLVDALTAHWQQQVVERQAASYWGDDDLVFTSSIGTWLERRLSMTYVR